MYEKIKISRTKRIICFFLALNLIFEIISPSLALALTSGPAQEEFASFEPSTTTDMVDLYSGDLTYNIPLMSVPGPNGGYPLNLAYHSGVGMEQEASWVGLGWSLNVGAINRQMRGLPDDFSGELIKKRQHMKESWMVALDIPKNKYREFSGLPPNPQGIFGSHIQVYYNNYKGMGYRYLANFSFPNKGGDESMWGGGLNVGFDSQNGLDVEPQLSIGAALKKTGWNSGFGLGLSYNSRQGLQKLSFSSGLSRKISETFNTRLSLNSNLSFAPNFNVPQTKMQTKTTSVPFNLKIAKPSAMKYSLNFPSKFPLLWSGYVSTTKMVNDGKIEFGAYGYLNNLATAADNVMRDFSRDDGQYSKKTPNLPMSSFTYDMFSQTGQGTGSNFRSYQNQIHVLSDPEILSDENSYDGEFEFGAGPGWLMIGNTNNIHIGLAFNYGSGQNRTGSWKTIKTTQDVDTTLTNLKNPQTFATSLVGKVQKHLYEDNYFKAYGEKTGYFEKGIDDQLSNYGDEDARRFDVKKEKNDANFLNRHYVIGNELKTKESATTSLLLSARTRINDGNRAKRANNIEYFTHAEAKKFGYSKNLQYYDSTNTLTPKFSTVIHGNKHLSEISMLQPDGMRYVYGLSTYNKKQVDNVFSSKNTGDFNTNTVNINSGSIEGIDIKGTQEEYMERNELPEYANGWLLTSIFSADYVDLTGDGPTDDDYGFWIKFNYNKIHNNYKWRAPYTGANFIEGYKNDPQDDKGSYTYGEKEIYFVQSIESKTHLAKFITSNRKDAIEAAGELSNTGTGTRALKKLDKIILYSKKDLIINGAAATPVKSVNFVYSYELCPGIPNNVGGADVTNDYYDETGNFVSGATNINTAQGKLTLKQVYYTYQNSKRSQLSPYIFKYGAGSQLNPSYERRNMDKWGNFKNNSGLYSSGNTYPFIDNPYTPQDPSFYGSGTNQLAPGQWSLKQVLLPTGGVMNVNYEFDDYFYEETLKAQRMYDIIGIGGNQNAARNGTALLGNVESYKIYIALEEPVSTKQEFYDKYIAKLSKNQVFYKVLAEMKGIGANNTFDYVSGYAEIDNNAASYDIESGGTVGYVSLKKVPLSKSNIGGTMVSPITRSIIEHLKTNRSELIHSAVPYASTAKAQILNVLASVSTVFSDISQAATGFNRWAYNNLYFSGANFMVKLNGNSIIRLCDPDEKIGGGVRVKKLAMDDNWKNGLTNDISSYGQEYDYTTTDENGIKISSGVSYEPQIGAEESALRTAIKYSSSSLFKSDYNMFVETPIAKSYYPGESVGYSKVTVRSIDAQELYTANAGANLPQSNAAPLSIYEFYTPKDFPIVVKETDNGPYTKPIFIPIPVLGLFTTTKRRQAKSQGYTVVINDMAGKPKSTSIYTAKLSTANSLVTSVPDKLVSKQSFIYNTQLPYSANSINELNNKVQTISVNGSYQTVYQTAVLGQTHDIFIDMNESSQEHESFGATGNLDVGFYPAWLPIPFITTPWVIPSYHKTTNNMRTVVFNKIIYKTGILNKTETTTDKSTIISENLAYDIETGQPLLTKVSNEFKDPIYNFSFPGHWYYKNLRAANNNFGIKATSGLPSSLINTTSAPSTGVISTANLAAPVLFTKGDLVYIESTTLNASGLYHVYTLNNSTIHCVDKDGKYFPGGANVSSIQIVKSGYKNLQNVQVGNLQFKSIKNAATTPDFVPYDPSIPTTSKLIPTNVTFDSPTDNKIINSSAVEMSDDWQMQCGLNTTAFGPPILNCSPTTISPFNTDLYAFLNYLKNNSLLFSKNIQIAQNNNSNGSPYLSSNVVFQNNFTSVLSNAFNCDMRMSNYVPANQQSPVNPFNINNVTSNGKNLWYSGFISPSTKNYVIILSNTPVPLNVIDPNALASNPNFMVSLTNFYNYPITGLKFEMPSAIFSSVTNPTAFWTTFVSNSPNLTQNLTPFCSVIPNKVGAICTTNILPYGNLSIQASCNFAYVNQNLLYNYFGGCYDCLNFSQICTLNTGVAPLSCGTQSNSIVNPYQNAMKGIWRTKRSYSFNTSRTQNENIREDGALTAFVRFPWENSPTKDAKWIESNTVTKYNQEGFEIENRNAIGNFSSALYGYQNSLNTAVANNARYSDVGVDNFEDYPKNCNQDHFSYSNYSTNVTNTEAHTGRYSIQVPNSTKSKVYRNIFVNCDNNTVNGVQYVNDNPSVLNLNPITGLPVSHIVKPCDCIGLMAPQLNKKYVVSGWVKQKSVQNVVSTNYTNSQIDISFYSATGFINSISFLPSGNIIDGWQRIYGEFTLPSNATSMSADLNNLINNPAVSVYFDDVRIQPFDATMKTFVYDAITSKVLAELDDNNYATIYNYDDEGNLIKVKRETEKGIKTVKEGRINSKKLAN